MASLSNYEEQLLKGWEDVYRKGQHTLWILLALLDGPKGIREIKKAMEEATKGTISPDDMSLYRALRKLKEGGIVELHSVPSELSGPARNEYYLTDTGKAILQAFIERNVKEIYTAEKIGKITGDLL